MQNLISVRHLIVDLWEQVLSSRTEALLGVMWDTQPNVAMHFKLNLSMTNHGYDKHGQYHKEWIRRKGRTIHTLVTARHRVYMASVNPDDYKGADAQYLEHIRPHLFKNVSNHDSEWSSAIESTIQDELREAYSFCFGFMPEGLRPAPCEVSVSTTFGNGMLNRSVLNFVEVGRKSLGDNYFDGLQSIRPLRVRMILESEPS